MQMIEELEMGGEMVCSFDDFAYSPLQQIPLVKYSNEHRNDLYDSRRMMKEEENEDMNRNTSSKSKRKNEKCVERCTNASAIPQVLEENSSEIIVGEIVFNVQAFQEISSSSSGLTSCEMDNYESQAWNGFRPLTKIETLSNGGIVTFHDSSEQGRLDFEDVIESLSSLHDMQAIRFVEKLRVYQKKIYRIRASLEELQEYYSWSHLEQIFDEVRFLSLSRIPEVISSFESRNEANVMYVYVANMINLSTFLQSPAVIGQSASLVELFAGNNETYTSKMLRKGVLSMHTPKSQHELLLLQTGVIDVAHLECKTIEGFSVSLRVTKEKHVLQSIKLNPVDYYFNSIICIYKIELVNPAAVENILSYRKTKQGEEALRDDLSYMMSCQMFLSKFYSQEYDLSTERRCGFTYIQNQQTVEPVKVSVNINQFQMSNKQPQLDFDQHFQDLSQSTTEFFHASTQFA